MLSYVNEKDYSFEKYYTLIIVEMSRNNDYTTDNLLDYEYFSKHYKLIAIDLCKQIELKSSDLKQQINFVGRFDKHNARMFFII